MSKNSKADNSSADIPVFNGLSGIRATLNSYGYKNEDIGFDDNTETVTLYGKRFMKPEVYDSINGITYASDNAIKESLKNFSSDPLKEVTPYYSAFAGKNNLPLSAIGFSDGSVTVGGSSVPYAYIDENNKAWAKQSDLDRAFNAYKLSSGVKSNSEIFDKYDSLYGDEIEKAVKKIKNRKEFSYDINDDPVYKAYKNMYESEGNRSAEDIMAAYSAQTGGYANSAAVTAAASARQRYSEKLNAMIPELEAQAYKRYTDELENDFKTLDSLRSLFADMFGMEYKVNRDTAENIYRAANEDSERDRYAAEAELEKRDRELEYQSKLHKLNSDYMFDEQKYRLGEQNYRLGEQNYRLGEQNYQLGEQKLKEKELDYLLDEQSYRIGEQKLKKGEMELITDSIKQEILRQEKQLNNLKIQNYGR